MISERLFSTFPCHTEKNSSEHAKIVTLRNGTEKNSREHAKAITLRSGKKLTVLTPIVVDKEKELKKVHYEANISKGLVN